MERSPGKLATVFGGSGFVGRYVVRALARRGWRVRVAVRRPELAGDLQPLGTTGQIMAVRANVRHAESVRAAVSHADAVVNLVGILAERGPQTFSAVQAEGARHVADAARDAGVTTLVQMSAIGSTADSAAVYAQTKAGGEAAAFAAMPEAVVVRPSIVFGPEDQFFNRFAGMARMSPVLPVVGSATRFQPVYVSDVGEFVAKVLDREVPGGRVYELGGPDVKTFRQLLEMMMAVTRQKRRLVELSFDMARLQAKALSWLPSPPITADQVELLKSDNVVSDAAVREGRTFAAAGMAPKSLQTVLPTYLWTYRRGGQFAEPGSAA